MWQSCIFGMHWKHEGKMYYDELTAESMEEAANYFTDRKRDDVALIRVELVGPDEPGVREYAHSPVSPFSPLKARRRMDKDEDARGAREMTKRESKEHALGNCAGAFRLYAVANSEGIRERARRRAGEMVPMGRMGRNELRGGRADGAPRQGNAGGHSKLVGTSAGRWRVDEGI